MQSTAVCPVTGEVGLGDILRQRGHLLLQLVKSGCAGKIAAKLSSVRHTFNAKKPHVAQVPQRDSLCPPGLLKSHVFGMSENDQMWLRWPVSGATLSQVIPLGI